MTNTDTTTASTFQANQAQRRAAQLHQYEGDLLTGLIFRRHSTSLRSVHGYQPAVGAQRTARALRVIVNDLPVHSEARGYLVSTLARACLPTGDAYQVAARLYDAAADAMQEGWRDVVGATGPEAGRPSDHQHRYTLTDALVVLMVLARAQKVLGTDTGTIGWCAQALADRQGVTL